MAPPKVMDTRPNIIFINTDQQSATMLSAAGNKYLKTPAMDRIANEGIRFERAYCTHPVCLPARFSFYTGRMPSELGIWNNKPKHLEKIPEDIMNNTVGQILKRAGYKVAYGGKTHLPADMSPESMGCEFISQDKRVELARTGAEWIKERAKANDGPFFLNLGFVNPHDICFLSMREYTRKERRYDDLNFNERWLLQEGSPEMDALNAAAQIPEGISEEEFFANVCPPLPANFLPQEDEPGAVREEVERYGFKSYIRENWTEREWRLHRYAYARLVERVDAQVGVILDALDESSLGENTLVIFTSDHGDQDAAHQLDQKGYLYEESIRIPLLFRWPARIPAGQVDTESLVSNGLDLLPTYCEIAGGEVPEGLIGKSLIKLTNDNQDGLFREALPVECEMGRAIVRHVSKYIRYKSGSHAEQLVDMVQDPYEMNNAIDSPKMHMEHAASVENFERLFSVINRTVSDQP